MKLKNIKRKKLNNKGFTLIELLAVVVILAVVMGIAMTSVLTAMNKSRGGSLADTASIIAQAFNQKRTEALVDGVPSNVYGGTNEPMGNGATDGYDFQASAKYYIDKKLADTFNISGGDTSSTASYILGTKGPVPTDAAITSSFISYNDNTGKFIACMIANPKGNYYVKAYGAGSSEVTLGTLKTPSTDSDIKNIKVSVGTMIACSDGTKSW